MPIKQAAIQYFDLGVVSLPRPARHHDIIWYVFDHYKRRTLGMDKQGFITDEGAFVSREEAWRIAETYDQIITREFGHGTLFSENLW